MRQVVSIPLRSRREVRGSHSSIDFQQLLQFFCLVLGIVAVFSATVTQATEKPNIIFVLFDDMSYGQPRAYRPESEFPTPNIDRLAAEGMRFTDAHSAASTCTPTRYGLITGRNPSRIGQYKVLGTRSSPIIPPERLTVASFLKPHGYHTACIGKWHLGQDWQKVGKAKKIVGGPITLGFDYFYGYTHARNIRTIIEQDTVIANVKSKLNQPMMIAKALEYIEDRAVAGDPFFLYFPICPPHGPIVPATEFLGQSGVTKNPKYGDWIFQGDYMLGQILDALDEHGLNENTLVIMSADNGARNRQYAPLKGAKGSINEGGHRMPFVARWTGKVAPGSVCDETISLNDLMATCADILETTIPADQGEDSVTILPYLLDTATGPLREKTIHQAQNGTLALRKGPWKLIFEKGNKRKLYNLDTDIGETDDVKNENPAVVEELEDLMDDYIINGIIPMLLQQGAQSSKSILKFFPWLKGLVPGL